MASPTVPCPTCGGGSKQLLANVKKTEAALVDTAFPRIPFVPRAPQSKVSPTAPTTSIKSAFPGGKCPDCGGSGKVPDPSDLTKKMDAAAKQAEAVKDKMADNEAEMGPPGGNRTTIIAGNETIQVGLGVNKAKSYNIELGATKAPSKVHIGEKASMPGHASSNYVHGTNPMSTPGGNYSLTVGNKITITAGAQGIDINTSGPINLNGGMVNFTGPQMSVGSSTGPTTIEGNHTQINGATVSLQATGGDKQVVIQGSMGIQSNVVVGGSAHVDGDLSFTSGSCPSKVDRTKFSSPAGGCSGKANWKGGGGSVASKDMTRTVSLFNTDPSMYMMTARGQQTMMQKMQNVAYSMMPLEPVQTGVILPGDCNVVGTGNHGAPVYSTNKAPIKIFNFVHVHDAEDGAHTHEMEVPNIKLTKDDVDNRSLNTNKQGASPVPSQSEDIQAAFKPAQAVGNIAGRIPGAGSIIGAVKGALGG